MRSADEPAPRTGRLTDADVGNVQFGKPPIGRRGYNEDEVDDFLDAVADTFAGRRRQNPVTAVDVHDVAFGKPPFGRRGYNEVEVDDFLDQIEDELAHRAHEAGGPRELGRGTPLGGGMPGPPVTPGMAGPPVSPPGPPMGSHRMGRATPPPPPQQPARPTDAGEIVRAIWERTDARDWRGVAELVDPTFVCEWPESHERFMGRDAWIMMNVNNPNRWRLRVDDVVASGDTAATKVRVADENGILHAASFWTVRDGRAIRVIEYYTREGSASPPEWRVKWSQRY